MVRFGALDKRRRVLAALAAALLLTGTACGDDGGGDSAEAPANEPVMGGTMVYASMSETPGWKTAELGRGNSEDRGQFVYDNLLLMGKDGGYVPNIATEVTSTDGKTWTMKLRPNVKFTDGTPLNADAVIFNINYTKDPANGSSIANLVASVQTMRAIDPTTVEFVLSTPNGTFPDVFLRGTGQIMSPTAYNADPVGFSTKPVGAGPFKLESWLKDSRAVLVKNPDYWNAPKPYLDKIELRIIPDAVTRGQSLVTGEVDLATAQPPVAAAVKGDPSKTMWPGTGNGHIFVAPNQDKPPFNDIRIRRAIAMAFDPKVVNDSLLQGGLSEPIMPCPPFRQGTAECVPGVFPPYDGTKAKALVQEYIREKGALGNYNLLAVNTNRDIAEFVQQALRDIGIPTTVNLQPTAEFALRLNQRACEVCVSENVGQTGPANGLFLNFHSTGLRHLQGGPADAALDKALSDYQFQVKREDRVAAGKNIAQIFADTSAVSYVSPTMRGFVGTTRVHMGDNISGGGLAIQDIWMAR